MRLRILICVILTLIIKQSIASEEPPAIKGMHSATTDRVIP